MIRRKAATAGLLLVLASMAATAREPAAPASMVRVGVSGDVWNAGVFEAPRGSRLAEVLVAAMPTDAAYTSGAVFTRREAIAPQLRLKAGLQHTLGELRHRALADGDATLADAAERIDNWLSTLPVTGRVAFQGDPRRLEVDPDANVPVSDGDHVHYARRPATVRVVGAVTSPCTLAHVPLRDAADVLRDCRVDPAADRDRLFVVQPDGHVVAIGTAAWNRSAAQALAPGATVVVPLRERALRDLDPAFNAELARFVATQPPGEAAP